jgi:hypothetical protein
LKCYVRFEAFGVGEIKALKSGSIDADDGNRSLQLLQLNTDNADRPKRVSVHSRLFIDGSSSLTLSVAEEYIAENDRRVSG